MLLVGRAVVLRFLVVAFLEAAFTDAARFAPVVRFLLGLPALAFVPALAFSCFALLSQYSARVSRAFAAAVFRAVVVLVVALGAAAVLRALAALRELAALLADFLEAVLVAMEVKGEVNQLQIRRDAFLIAIWLDWGGLEK